MQEPAPSAAHTLCSFWQRACCLRVSVASSQQSLTCVCCRAWLQASAESSLINGQVLVADGGWTLVAGALDTANPDKIWYE